MGASITLGYNHETCSFCPSHFVKLSDYTIFGEKPASRGYFLPWKNNLRIDMH